MSFFKGFLDELLKLGSFEAWGMGGDWNTHAGEPTADGSPLLHEQSIPYDVEWKNFRRDYFHSRVMPVEEGKMVRPGMLSPASYKDLDQDKLDDKHKGKPDGKKR